MRMMPDRYVAPRPATIKRQVSQMAHVSAPLKGLSLSSKLTTGDPLTAPILTNFVVEDDRITARAGYRKLAQVVDGSVSVKHLIPFYGANPVLAAAANKKIFLASTGALIKGGFTSDDWHWTSFSNLGVADYTVLVNGQDGVWSWDGSAVPDPGGPVTVTSLSNSNPARCTVAAADIGKFAAGMTVTINGATATGMGPANGRHAITSVGTPANTFTLVGVDTSAATAPQTSGVTADPETGLVRETVSAPTSATWVVPSQFNVVLSHQNRLWFADKTNLAVYYLPLQQKSGQLEGYLPLNAVFRRGGSIRAMYTWSIEGGLGLNDQLVIFSTNGECAIYSGTDPATDFQLAGLFRFDSPMSKHSVVQFGGDLYVLISTGLVPMSTMLRSESEQLGQTDRNVVSLFLGEATKYRDREGWQAFLNPSTNRCMCNIPQGAANRYIQMVRHMIRPVWSQYQDLPARCWGWIDPYVYFGDDSGNVYQMHPSFLNDDGNPIRVDVQMAWSQFKTPANKQFKMVQTYMVTDAVVRPFIDIKVDYDLSPPEMQPDITVVAGGAVWDVATWDEDDWASGPIAISMWNGVSALGRVGAPRLTAYILNAEFSITGWDVIFEPGAAI